MYRIEVSPRRSWKKKVESQGLVFEETIQPNGEKTHYWNENAAYVFNYTEVDELEKATEKLHEMSIETAKFLADEQYKQNTPFNLNIPQYAKDYARDSLYRADLNVYGRFDLVYNNGLIKMLEYNADTPTGLVEASIVQWYWLQDKYPDCDQWNSIHESLVNRFGELKMQYGKNGETLHFAHTELDDSGEDLMTTAYMRDCAMQANWNTAALTMSEIGFDNDSYKFVDLENKEIKHLFKLYPWEDMMNEGFGEVCAELSPVWFEPAWKMFLSTKVLPAAMWHLYPDHEYLLKSTVGDPGLMTEYVEKPLWGREGDGINIFINNTKSITSNSHRWGSEGYAYQELFPLPEFVDSKGKSHHPVLGSWVVGGESVGVGIRESDGLITDEYCRFVPNIIFKESDITI